MPQEIESAEEALQKDGLNWRGLKLQIFPKIVAPGSLPPGVKRLDQYINFGLNYNRVCVRVPCLVVVVSHLLFLHSFLPTSSIAQMNPPPLASAGAPVMGGGKGFKGGKGFGGGDRGGGGGGGGGGGKYGGGGKFDGGFKGGKGKGFKGGYSPY